MRWSGPFETPNIAALAAASVAMALLILSCAWWRSGRYVYSVAAGAGTCACVTAIAATGSRAGGLALLAGLIVLWLQRTVPARVALALTGILGLCSWAFPLGARAAASIGDASITHRLDLWLATLQLIGDHPWSGVGPDHCMSALDEWYLPEKLRRLFYSPINSILALGAYFGIWMISIVAALATFVACVLAARPSRGRALPALALALLSIHVLGSCFQGHWYFHSWWWVALPSGMLVTVALVQAVQHPGLAWKRSGLFAAGTGLALGGIVSIASLMLASQHPFQTRWHDQILVGQRRDAVRAPVLLVHADSITRPERGINHLESRLRNCLVTAGFASAVVEYRNDNYQAAGLLLHKQAAEALVAAVDDPIRGFPLVLLDPWIDREPRETSPAIGASGIMLLSQHAPFVDAKLCRRWAAHHQMRVLSMARFTTETISLPGISPTDLMIMRNYLTAP